MNRTSVTFSICLIIGLVFWTGLYQEESDTCAERMVQLRDALERHRLIYNDYPESLAELRLKNLVPDLDMFLCNSQPGSLQRIEDIEEKGDFAYRPDLPAYSGSPVLLAHKAGDQFDLALYEDGTIQALTADTPGTPPQQEQAAENADSSGNDSPDNNDRSSQEESTDTGSAESSNLGNVFIVILVLSALIGGVFLVRTLVVRSAGEYRTKVAKEQIPTHQMKTMPDGETPEIELQSSGGQSKVFPLKRFPVFIGRAADNHISIREESVSRRHARIDLEGDTLIISDMGSTNGLFVNGKRVKSQRLSSGMTVEIGTNRLQLVPNNKMKKQM